MNAQLLSAVFAGAGLLVSLVTAVVVLQIKLSVQTSASELRKEMRDEYVSKETYNREHPIGAPIHRGPQVS